jgi:hypothetical protein
LKVLAQFTHSFWPKPKAGKCVSQKSSSIADLRRPFTGKAKIIQQEFP